MSKLSAFVPSSLVMSCGGSGAKDVIQMLLSERVHAVSLSLYAARADLAVLVKERWEEMRKVKQPRRSFALLTLSRPLCKGWHLALQRTRGPTDAADPWQIRFRKSLHGGTWGSKTIERQAGCAR